MSHNFITLCLWHCFSLLPKEDPHCHLKWRINFLLIFTLKFINSTPYSLLNFHLKYRMVKAYTTNKISIIKCLFEKWMKKWKFFYHWKSKKTANCKGFFFSGLERRPKKSSSVINLLNPLSVIILTLKQWGCVTRLLQISAC